MFRHPVDYHSQTLGTLTTTGIDHQNVGANWREESMTLEYQSSIIDRRAKANGGGSETQI